MPRIEYEMAGQPSWAADENNEFNLEILLKTEYLMHI